MLMEWDQYWGEQHSADLGANTLPRTYTVEMYPALKDVEYIQWTQITPELYFEEAHTVPVTLGECAPGYRYRITKINRED